MRVAQEATERMRLIGDAFTQQTANLHGETDQLSARMAGLTINCANKLAT